MIFLALVFPPAWPFVIAYYLLRGNGQRRSMARQQAAMANDLHRIAGVIAPVPPKQPGILAPIAWALLLFLGFVFLLVYNTYSMG